MRTQPLYLDDPYLKAMEGTVLEVIVEKDAVWRVILDQTVFYPMGGGQPTDQGIFTFSDGTSAEVNQVLLKEGEINHFVKRATAPKAGEKVTGKIDWERRYKNMKVHSAGHVVDFAMFLLGHSPALLKPFKGDHGKKPFVQYSGTIDRDIRQELEEKSNELIAKDLKFSWSFEPLEKIEKEALYLQPGLPKHKPLRALRLQNVGTVADGGTIVASTKEVGKIAIVSIEVAEGITSIHYRVE